MNDAKRWILRTPDVLDNCVNRLRQLPDDEIWEVTARPYKKNRSREQNDLMWVLTTLLGDHMGYHKDEMHEETMRLFLAPKTHVGANGEVRERWSTKNLPVGEMSAFIDALYQLAAEEGLYVPPRQEAA